MKKKKTVYCTRRDLEKLLGLLAHRMSLVCGHIIAAHLMLGEDPKLADESLYRASNHLHAIMSALDKLEFDDTEPAPKKRK